MAETAAKPQSEVVARPEFEELLTEPTNEKAARERTVARLRLLWEQRQFLFRVTALGLVAATAIAFLIPKRYESTTRLMPPDNQSTSGLAMAAAALSGRAGGLGGIAGDLLGLKSTSELFVGILGSRTVEDKLIQQFDLKKVYRDRRMEDVRKDLADHTEISVDRKSQIITIKLTDRSPQRAAAMAQAYVEELNRLVAELSTSSARRERIFLEGRLQAVKQDLEAAEKDFSQFASKNTAIDIKEQGRAMVEAAATLQGHLIAAQSELEGLRQIYTENNVRVRSIRARIGELQRQLEKLGGKDTTGTAGADPPGEPLYPSIRKLPLLGVPYADLFRRMKVQEAIFETLTQEYELAKVQEAKEIPTVKVLDFPVVPEKKSFPPRLLITLLGTFAAFVLGMAWVLGREAWAQWDTQDPGRVLIAEVGQTISANLAWVSSNGHPAVPVWRRMLRRTKTAGDLDEATRTTVSRTKSGELNSNEEGRE